MMMRVATALILCIASPEASLGLERNRLMTSTKFEGINEATKEKFTSGMQSQTTKIGRGVFHYASFFSEVEEEVQVNDKHLADRFMQGNDMSMPLTDTPAPTEMPVAMPASEDTPVTEQDVNKLIEQACSKLGDSIIDKPNLEEVEVIFYFEAQTTTNDFRQYLEGGVENVITNVIVNICTQVNRRVLVAPFLGHRKLDVEGISRDLETSFEEGCDVTADGAEYCYTVGIKFTALVTPGDDKDKVRNDILDLIEYFGENDQEILKKYAPEFVDLTYLGTDPPSGFEALSVTQDSSGMSTSGIIGASAGAAGLVAIALAIYTFRQRPSPNGDLFKPEFDSNVDDDSSTDVSTNSERNIRGVESFSPLEDISEESHDATTKNKTSSFDEES